MKTAIITGADGGMGYQETKEVAAAGYHVIMACYNIEKAEGKRQSLIRETHNEHIEIMHIDLANLSSVLDFANQVKMRIDHLHLLMNNAGTLETGRHITVDGLERTVSVNYVGPWLLTRLLLPLMGQGSRIVNMASCVYPLGRLHFPHFFLQGRKGAFWRIPVYCNTKLAILLFTLCLAERLKDSGITVNAADPGIVDTEIIRMHMFIDPLTDLFFRPLIRTPRQGADTAIRLLLDDSLQGVTCSLFRSGHPVRLGSRYTAHAQKEELWQLTEEIVAPFLS